MYIVASRSLNLYTGITNNMYRRALEHKGGEVEGFTKKYHINRLVYYETFKYVRDAIRREKQIKSWTRAKRLALIKSTNPTWQDLAEDWASLSNCRSLASLGMTVLEGPTTQIIALLSNAKSSTTDPCHAALTSRRS